MIKIVGIGTSGCTVVDKMNFLNAETYAIDDVKEKLEKISIKNKLLLGEELTKGFGSLGDILTAYNIYYSEKSNILKFLQKANKFYIITGYGEATGLLITQRIAEDLKNKNMNVECIIIKPFSFMGKMRSENHMKCLEELESKGIKFKIIEADSAIPYSEKSITLEKSFNLVDEKVIEYMEQIIR